MCVCGFEVHVGVYLLICVVEWLEKECCVQEVNLICVYGVFDGVMVVIEGVEKLGKGGNGMGPDADDVIQITEVEGRQQGAFVQGLSLPLAHVDVCI